MDCQPQSLKKQSTLFTNLAMPHKKKKSLPDQAQIRQQLYRLTDNKDISLDFVSAVAGDRRSTADEKALFQRLYRQRGDGVYVDLLFALTHQYYPEESAPSLWDQIINHKEQLSKTVGRNVGIAVATLDYLGNIHNELEAAAVISKHKISRIAEIAITDGLTELFDVTTFHAKLETEIKRFKRYGSEVSILMMDVDDFKQFNDTHGHQKGDLVLAEIALLIEKTTRELDICCRYGGEEFSVILPQTGIKEAVHLAQRIRRRVEKKYKKVSNLTISVGVAACPSMGKSANVLIKKADKALYHSKRRGKNRVATYHQGKLAEQK
jgi:diguanylate cyclase (GGDEF)-like protein